MSDEQIKDFAKRLSAAMFAGVKQKLEKADALEAEGQEQEATDLTLEALDDSLKIGEKIKALGRPVQRTN